MKQKIFVELENTSLCLLSGITFAQTPYWFPFYNIKDLKMDILRPFGPPKEKLPLLVWICGGAWITMDRAAHIPNLMYFAKQGYIVASVEYRMSNCATFPAQLQDIKSAIRYLRVHAQEYGIDPERVAVMGESAGGYLAAMTGVTGHDSQWDKGENPGISSAVNAVVDYYGPTDFTLFSSTTPQNPKGSASPETMLLGYSPSCAPEEAASASVSTYVTKETPPFFILHGLADPVVPYAQSDVLYDALQKAGVRSEYYLIEEAGHAAPQFYQESTNEKIIGFLDSILK